MGFVNCKNAAQFPFMQPKNTSLVPNTTPFIDFGLNLLATGCVEQTIRISVVMSPVNFSFFNRVKSHELKCILLARKYLLAEIPICWRMIYIQRTMIFCQKAIYK